MSLTAVSSEVERALRESFAAVLGPAGFTRRGRNWWAHREGGPGSASGTPDPSEVSLVISTASIPAWPADVIGISRASFSVELGVAHPAVTAAPWALLPGRGRHRVPVDSCSPLRGVMLGTVPAETPHPRESGRVDLYAVRGDGSNLARIVDDATARLRTYGLPGIQALAEPRRALRFVLGERELAGVRWGTARPTAPVCVAAAAALAFALGDDELGRRLLNGPALDSLARTSTLRAEIDAVIDGGPVRWRDVDAEHEHEQAERRRQREERAQRRAVRARRGAS